jgi:putative transposase
MGLLQQAFYGWKKRYAGVGVSEWRELRQLREENRRLKTLVADLTLDKQILQEVLSKKSDARRTSRTGREYQAAIPVSQRRACGLMGITHWSNRYRSGKDPPAALRLRCRELAASRVRYGYRRLAMLLRREGWKVNAKRVYRLYRQEGLQVRTAKRTRCAAGSRVALPGATRPNQRWSMDFVSDRLADGRWFRILTVVDQYTRECLCVHAERSQTGRKVVEQLTLIVAKRGAPKSITSDNELNASRFLQKRRQHSY